MHTFSTETANCENHHEQELNKKTFAKIYQHGNLAIMVKTKQDILA